MKSFVVFVLLITGIYGCSGPQSKPFPASTLHFEHFVTNDPKDSSHYYSLIGRSIEVAIRKLQNHYSDSIIQEWFKAHPAAIAVPVTSVSYNLYKLRDIDTRTITVTYCWIMDKQDTLNLQLLKKGCVHKLMVSRPLNSDELLYGEEGKTPDKNQITTQHLSKAEYKKFAAGVKAAYDIAQQEGAGIYHRP